MTAMRPTAATVELVRTRDADCCAKCGHMVSGIRGFDWSIHHRRPAGAGGDRRPETHAAGNLVILHGHGCSGCHGEVESRRADAIDKGLLISKHSPINPAAVAIEHALFGWCYLLDDGSVAYDPPTPDAELTTAGQVAA